MQLVHQRKVAAVSVPPQQRVKEFAGEHFSVSSGKLTFSVPAEKSVSASTFLRCVVLSYVYDVLGFLSKS